MTIARRGGVTLETALLLEEIATNAVAPPTVLVLGGWLVRAWPAAPFRRANSVLPIRGDGGAIEERIALVEAFYRRRALPVRFQVGPVVAPADLDRRLAARGYEVEAASQLHTAAARDVISATAREPRFDVSLVEDPDASWVAAHAGAQGEERERRRRIEAYGEMMIRVRPRCAVATASVRGAGVAGIGFAVLERGWAGIFGMGTHPRARRTGVATALLNALARHALDRGAGSLYLQVEAENEPALRLYSAAGFGELYGYHYRSLSLPPAGT
jgi:ribosomal protein S18 acetylase RimI-like enzyme